MHYQRSGLFQCQTMSLFLFCLRLLFCLNYSVVVNFMVLDFTISRYIPGHAGPVINVTEKTTSNRFLLSNLDHRFSYLSLEIAGYSNIYCVAS